MRVQRRTLLGAVVAAAGLSACGDGDKAGTSNGSTSMWIWPGGLDAAMVTQAVQHFASKTKLTVTTLEGNYQDQLSPVLDGSGVPDIAGIKGEDMSAVLPRADLFVDLNTLGARELQDNYLDWKWQQGSTLDNRLVGFPIDTGPTALFYRHDVFQKAGLAAEPDDVAVAIKDWHAYLDFGRKLVRKVPSVRLFCNAADLFSSCIGQSNRRYVSESNSYIGDTDTVRTAWDLAVESMGMGISAGIPNASDKRFPAYEAGKVASDTGPAWLSQDLASSCAKSAGKWRVANGCADGANQGGSFLSIPAKGDDHETAFEVIQWLLSPENQAKMFAGAKLFPSAPAAYQMPELQAPDPFFGGQRTTPVFATSAGKAKLSYEAPSDFAIEQIFITQLEKLESGGTTAAAAWRDAVDGGRKLAASKGVITG
ncbi:ABC transporter substrate-binding protein [Actinoplanes sp. NBRC 103695]|uniref:ABC transporter substrate-binding protein n=1 Tax=Actinoplanes sp. NBRC 103695 TaxID=3032202 RepID=UPI0024A3CCD5|nr:ABC transporter substrate-binding protein [Actinoplanes sp. NBRC 103695]GLY97331.1 sugar ABC transporter substrate-binding protein [Actinoplanes sp. NBRC 103695]